MTKLRIFVFLFILLGSIAFSAHSPIEKQVTLRVLVKNIKQQKGQVMVALFDNKDSFLEDDFLSKSAKVGAGDSVIVVFEGVPVGKYAASVFHDKNSNGELDTNLIGIPKEGFGFSNDAKGFMGPPSFENAMFELSSDLEIEMSIYSIF